MSCLKIVHGDTKQILISILDTQVPLLFDCWATAIACVVITDIYLLYPLSAVVKHLNLGWPLIRPRQKILGSFFPKQLYMLVRFRPNSYKDLWGIIKVRKSFMKPDVDWTLHEVCFTIKQKLGSWKLFTVGILVTYCITRLVQLESR